MATWTPLATTVSVPLAVAVLALVLLPVAVFVVCAGTSAAVPSRKAPDRAA